MRRSLLAGIAVALLSVAALPARDTSLAGWFDLPVQGGSTALAALGIDADERALTLPILARALYDRQSRLGRSADIVPALLAAATVPTVGAVTEAETIAIPAPLDAETWRN